MLFPNDARKTICEGLNCPSKNARRTQGICIQKKNGEYFQIDSDAPSVVILFRDPTIADKDANREVKYVLDIKKPKENVNSTLFTFYKTYFLDFFPENEIIYLDNFIRCKMPFTSKELNKKFLELSDPYAACCCKISLSFLEKLPNLKCLIISDVKAIISFGKKDFLTNLSSDIKQFINNYQDEKSKNGENSTILLNERFNLLNFNFPVLFFLHPNTLQLQYEKWYALGKKYCIEFEDHQNMIFEILKEFEIDENR